MSRLPVALAAAIFALIPEMVEAQERSDLPRDLGQEVVQKEDDKARVTLGLAARMSVIFSSISSEGNFDKDRFSLFDTGWGLDADVGLLGRVGKRAYIGAFFSLNWEHYDGIKTTDGVTTLHPDDLETVTFLAGPRFVTEGKYVALEMHLGFGATSYSAVKGRVEGGPAPGNYSFMEQSSGKFVFELGLPTVSGKIGNVALGIGGSFRFGSHPDNGDYFLHNGGWVTVFSLHFGGEVRF